MAYATLAEVRAALSLPATSPAGLDGRLTDALNSATQRVNEYCSRDFEIAKASSKEYLLQNWRLPIPVSDYLSDTASVVAVRRLRSAEYTTLDQADWLTWPVNPGDGRPASAIKLLSSQPDGLLRLTAQYGWPAVPPAIKSATILLAERHFKRQEAPLGITGTGEFGVAYAARSDADAYQLLDPFRKITIG